MKCDYISYPSLVIDVEQNCQGNTCKSVTQEKDHHILPFVFRAIKKYSKKQWKVGDGYLHSCNIIIIVIALNSW